MGSEEQKEKARIKRRNMIAKDLKENKLYRERRIKDVTKETKRQNNQHLIKDYYTNDESMEEDCQFGDVCSWPYCGCSPSS